MLIPSSDKLLEEAADVQHYMDWRKYGFGNHAQTRAVIDIVHKSYKPALVLSITSMLMLILALIVVI
jgi:hypothetical protein